MEYTLTDIPPELKVETIATTVAKAEADLLLDGLTHRLAVAKLKKLA